MVGRLFGVRKRRREARLMQLDRWRVARRIMDEDVTVLGEQLAELHVDTLDPATAPRSRTSSGPRPAGRSAPSGSVPTD